jgi:hypothetical protein
MNRQGHSATLVAAHPGNQSALKAGVFSSRALTPRIEELEAAVAAHPVLEVVLDGLRHEIAALGALGEAMDASLAEEGIRGRGGQPRTLITLRLRLNEKLRRTLENYQRVHAEREEGLAQTDDGVEAKVDPSGKLNFDIKRLSSEELQWLTGYLRTVGNDDWAMLLQVFFKGGALREAPPIEPSKIGNR